MLAGGAERVSAEGRYGDYQLRPATDADQPRLLTWRNHPEVRRSMINDHEIGAQEHRAWWARVKADPTRRWYLLERDGEALAVINYYDLPAGDLPADGATAGEGWWGFYLTDMARHDGAGRMHRWLVAEEVAVRHAFAGLGLGRLLCETLAGNAPVLALHRRFGFREVARKPVERAGGRDELVVMALTPADAAVAGAGAAPAPAPRRVALLGDANWGLAAAPFEVESAAAAAGPSRVVRLPFGQWRMALAEGDTGLAEADYLVFCQRFEELLEGPHHCAAAGAEAALAARLDDYLAQIAAARGRFAGRFLVLDLAPVRPAPDSLEAGDEGALAALLERLNRRLREGLAGLADCRLVALSALVAEFGARRADPSKYWHLGRAPFHGEFVKALCRRLLGAMLAWEGRAARLVVLDLDNTLWGGVVGDDGLAGIRLGGDHPGSLFSAFQHYLKRLHERGVALAIASKNSEAVALEALREHPGMVLRPEEFVAMRINWSPKPQNLAELAEEVGLGLGSLLFLDDNPAERAEVRAALPEVVVPELPADPAAWPAFLADLPMLAAFALTAEDRRRAEQYRHRATLRREEGRFADRQAFLASLAMRLSFYGAEPVHWQRILQLLAKTNQFNATTRRHGERELQAILAEGGEVVAVGLADRFGGEEIIGLAILRFPGPTRAMVDTFLLSCRVLGRGVETAMLAELAARARARGAARLEGEIVETPRNMPVRTLYADHGFRDEGDGHWSAELAQATLERPAWFV
ncbi:HAD-IIIC family phosphatase [Endothiovibrio diazotrophicus]